MSEEEPLELHRSERRGLAAVPGWILREVRSRPFAYIVFFSFVLAGPFLVPLIFPEAPAAVGWVGGICFGAYAALCAVPQKFL